MAHKPRITTSRSRAFDALIGSGFAAMVIGVAVLGDIAYEPSHKVAFPPVQVAKSSAATTSHCRNRMKSVCGRTVCAGREPCWR